MEVSGLRHAPAALWPGGKDPSNHCTGGWVGLTVDLDREATGKILSPLTGIEPRSSGRAARGQTLY
jgi:hypothetical protein